MRELSFALFILVQAGCAGIFGWDIHAPGILSEEFFEEIDPVNERVALYLDPALLDYRSQDRGGKTADPQTYHVGEALAPMLVEAFQNSFEEFIFLETEPSSAVLRQYAIPYVAVVRLKGFKNRVTWRGQAITLITETAVLDQDLNLVDQFESAGTSDAQKVFAKRGGPQVNLNAAIENNVKSVVQYLQDAMRGKAWLKEQANRREDDSNRPGLSPV